MRIAIAGGTGTVGSHVASAVRERGHEPVVLARSAGVDVLSGRGVQAALDGCEVLIDVLNTSARSRSRAELFFTTSTQQLLRCGAIAGIRHYVVLSIVGCDRVDFGYYFGKRLQERTALAADTPATVLRTTQFHEFAWQLLTRARGPVALIPKARVQPVAAAEAGRRLAELALGPALGMAAELAGPEPHDLVDLARRTRTAAALRRRILPVRPPGPAGGQMANGGLLPQTDGPRGEQTFGEWLAGNFT